MAAGDEDWVDITDEKDGGVLKKILIQGAQGDYDYPPVGSIVKVHYTGTLAADGSKFDSSRDRPGNFEFEVGVGQVIRGWDIGVLTMRVGETCMLRCRAEYGYGDQGAPPAIPGGATLEFEVELFAWEEKPKPAALMTPEERMQHCMRMKESGTDAFKKQDWATAINRYQDAIEHITLPEQQAEENGESRDDRLNDEEKKLAVALLNNCAAARLKMQDFDLAKFDCCKVLEYDKKNVKALFRRAQAKHALGEHSSCVVDASTALELDPDNKEVQALKRKAQEAQKQAKQNEKAMCSKMFG
eukprot:TRINITY_DN26613_c0_g1_i2.p1 TRINITY_DN26613_c0_g1~~TRINITY_DN26613_c0_g1_i2.p1  ORF type:complete len:300 (-),score=69.92 TRINITY_DN26613_c0_g1_i2:87-986(-)